MTDFGKRPIPNAHKTTHQDAGSDEISVSGLSGTLADSQTAIAHDLAGALHDADTLSDLNTKVSDATLDDSGAARTPSSHASSHQDGGSDEISLTDLTGKINFVDRGDPDGDDWTQANFTTDNTWNDLDCSSIVPAGAIAIVFNLGLVDDVPGSYFQLRKNGNSNGYNVAALTVQVDSVVFSAPLIVHCDANRVIEYKGSNVTFASIWLTVRGWFI